jgi:esterase/lipase
MIHSRGDVAASPQAAERAFHAMAAEQKRLVWVDRSNHHVFWDYEADTVAQEIESFLGRP